MNVNQLIRRETYPDLDVLKLFLAYLVLARHLVQTYSQPGIFLYVLVVNTISPISVPAFFVISGFLLYKDEVKGTEKTLLQIKRVLYLYFVWSLIYLPLNISDILQQENIAQGVLQYFQNILFSGSYYHLWFLPALAVGIGLVFWIEKLMHSQKKVLGVTVCLFMIGLFGDSWMCWCPNFIEEIYECYRLIFVTTRNGVFFAPVFVYTGELLARNRGYLIEEHKMRLSFEIFTIGSGLLIIENYLLFRTMPDKINNMLFFTLLISVALVMFGVQRTGESGFTMLRSASTVIFCVHPWVIRACELLPQNTGIALQVVLVTVIVTLTGFIVPLLVFLKYCIEYQGS